jgi:transcriptional regulator with XRE-family HTH domain
MTVNEAVLELRRHLKKTQQVFATELKMSISSLQNYERDRTPAVAQLLAFQQAAREAGREDLAEVLDRAVYDLIGRRVTETMDEFEATAVGVVIAVIRHYALPIAHRADPSAARAMIGSIAAMLKHLGHPSAEFFAEEAIRRGFMNKPSRREKK